MHLVLILSVCAIFAMALALWSVIYLGYVWIRVWLG